MLIRVVHSHPLVRPGRKVLFRALKPMCGPGVRSFYLTHYDMDRSMTVSRKAFEERVRARLSPL